MGRAAAVALGVYALLMGSLTTSWYAGDDDRAQLVMIAGAHLGVGIVVRRWWVLLAPLPFAAGFALAGSAELPWAAFALFALPPVGVTAIGWLIGSRLHRRASAIGAAAFAIAALAALWAASAAASS